MTSNIWVGHLQVDQESRDVGCINSPPGGKIKGVLKRVELWCACLNKQRAVAGTGSSHDQI